MSLQIKNISKKFISRHKQLLVLDNISLEIEKGQFICLLGPSGCGKTTLVNIIAGLEKPSEGMIFHNDKEVKAAGTEISVVFQEPALFPWLSVIDNVAFGMKMAGVSRKERLEKAMDFLKMVNLINFENLFIHELSGGMKQRVAIARSLTMDSDILLMDEPFSALDSQTRGILHSELLKIWSETKKTIIFVTHSIEESVLLADRVITMSTNPGRIKRDYFISSKRPRTLESPEISGITSDILQELKEEVEKIAKNQNNNSRNFKKNTFLCNFVFSLGSYL